MVLNDDKSLLCDHDAYRLALKAVTPAELELIQKSCRARRAFCFARSGVRIVLKPMSQHGVPFVLIWLALASGSDNIPRYLPEVRKLTRMAGGRWAQFHTRRRGWVRVARRLGFARMPDDENGRMVFRVPV